MTNATYITDPDQPFTLTGKDLDEALDGVLVAMVWFGLDYSLDEDGTENAPPLDDNYDVGDVTDEARTEVREDIVGFIRGNLADCLAYVRECETGGRVGYSGHDGSPWAWLGHDFALTRNHHGAGFWDRGLGDLGDRLTKACQVYGSADLYAGDDGRLYVGG